MDVFGIGLWELLFIGLILLLVLGPTELVTLGRKTGQFIRRIRQSDTWNMVANLALALRNLPKALADETRMDEIFGDVVPRRDRQTIAPPTGDRSEIPPNPDRDHHRTFSAWTSPPATKKVQETPAPEQTPPAGSPESDYGGDSPE
ncbi:MAG TPA: twin-arginine translocase TatA/TatE family subunit [Anaerolineales bacterium]|nr:twin-arginine translocase TatA/TatE family subunit [Anaerolineales bacterium]